MKFIEVETSTRGQPEGFVATFGPVSRWLHGLTGQTMVQVQMRTPCQWDSKRNEFLVRKKGILLIFVQVGLKGHSSMFFFPTESIDGRMFVEETSTPFIGGLVSEQQAIMVSLYTTVSGDSWMYPDPNVPLWEIPKLTPIFPGYQNGFFHPQEIPSGEHQLNPGYQGTKAQGCRLWGFSCGRSPDLMGTGLTAKNPHWSSYLGKMVVGHVVFHAVGNCVTITAILQWISCNET